MGLAVGYTWLYFENTSACTTRNWSASCADHQRLRKAISAKPDRS